MTGTSRTETHRNRRRPFARTILALFACFMLSACASKNERGSRSGTLSAYNLKVDKSRLSRTLNVFIYPDYIAPELVPKFEQTYGVKVVMDNYDTNEAMIAKLQAGGVGQYDLLVPSDYAVTILSKQHLLEPLDPEVIPNLKNLSPRFRKLPFDPGNRYSVCYQWGISGIGIRTDLVNLKGRDVDTWKIMFDPKDQLGPFTMLDDPRETIGAALMYLGYSVNTTDPAQLKQAEELLLKQRKRVLAYASSSTAQDLLVSGDVAVAHNFSGTVFMAQSEVKTIRFIIPREGAILWTDNLAIPAQAPHKYTAEVFINFILDAKNGAALTNYTKFASPNRASLPYILPEIRNNPAIFPDERLLDHFELIRDLGEATRMYDRIWTRVNASSGK